MESSGRQSSRVDGQVLERLLVGDADGHVALLEIVGREQHVEDH